MFQMVINNKRVLFVQGLGESELPGVLDFVKSQPDNSSKQVAFIGVPATSISAKVVEALSEGFKVHFVDNHGIFGTLPPNVSLDDLRESTIRIKVRLEQRALIAGGSRKRCYAGLIDTGEFKNARCIVGNQTDKVLLGIMKAAGAPYRTLDDDSEVMEGPLAKRCSGSAALQQLVRGFEALTPSSADDGTKRERDMEALFSAWVAAAQAMGKVESLVAAYEADWRLTYIGNPGVARASPPNEGQTQ